MALMGASKIVASCPGCTTQLIEKYDLDAMHIVEYLFEEVGTHRISRSAKARKVKIAVHHPCHLSRSVGPHTIDYTLGILQALPGVSIVETGDENVCCGAGGGLLSGYPEIAGKMAMRKMSNAFDAGAELMVTTCPFCVMNLARLGDIRVMDIMDLIRSFMPRS
jgi:Fe-S oxidoreductase